MVEKQISRLLQVRFGRRNRSSFKSENLFSRLKPVGTQAPYLRRSSKVHKSEVLLRPLLCVQNSGYHKTVRRLVNVIASGYTKTINTTFSERFIRAIKFAQQRLSDSRQNALNWLVTSSFGKVSLHEMTDFYAISFCDKISSIQSH